MNVIQSADTLDDYFAAAEPQQERDGIFLIDKIEMGNLKQFPFEDYELKTDTDKGNGFGLISENRQVGYAYSQKIKFPREMFVGDKGTIHFEAKGNMTLDNNEVVAITHWNILARVFYKIEGDRVRLAIYNGFYWE